MTEDEVVNQWEPRIRFLSKKYKISGYDEEDISQELRIEVVRAHRNYDSSRGSFSTFLYKCFSMRIHNLITYSKAKKRDYFTVCFSEIEIDLISADSSNIEIEYLEYLEYLGLSNEALEAARMFLSGYKQYEIPNWSFVKVEIGEALLKNRL